MIKSMLFVSIQTQFGLSGSLFWMYISPPNTCCDGIDDMMSAIVLLISEMDDIIAAYSGVLVKSPTASGSMGLVAARTSCHSPL